MRKQITVILIIISAVLPGARGLAQIAGNPAGTLGQPEWSVSLGGGYFYQQVGPLDGRSQRILLKVNRGLLPWLDIYALGGAADLKLLRDSETITDYEDKFRFLYGAGINVSWPPPGNQIFRLWAGGQAFRFQSKGAFTEEIWNPSETHLLLTKRYHMEYDWREIKAFAGVILDFKAVRIYAAGAGWILDRVDLKNEYWETHNSSTHIGKAEGEFNTGLWYGAIAGLEFPLSGNYAITMEGLAFNQQNFQIMIGISQTGSPKMRSIFNNRR
jgi:hypothetical protein